MTTYRPEYKCRRCGDFFVDTRGAGCVYGVGRPTPASEEYRRFCYDLTGFSERKAVHFACRDTDTWDKFGLGDFVGFREVEG